MIEKMRKYTFVLYHQEYESFLVELQKLGLVHIIRSRDDKTESQTKNLELMQEYGECIKFLTKLKSIAPKQTNPLPTKALLNRINEAREEKEKLQHSIDMVKKQIRDLTPWGHFDYNLVHKLKEAGLTIRFHTCLKNHFKPEWQENYPVKIINEVGGIVYFIVITDDGDPCLEADTFSFHKHTLQELEDHLSELQNKQRDIDEYLYSIAPTAIEMFNEELKRLSNEYEFEDAMQQGEFEAENTIRLISGWIPVSLEQGLKDFLEKNNVIYFAEEAKAEENPPIKLKNNWFARLFEPISKMYMLPYYNEFDLTPFFAPFFALFFGFCNADIGYGIVIIILAVILKLKLKNKGMKDIMSLLIIFGASSIIMGWVMGSALAYDLKTIPALADKILIKDNNQIFNYALLLGAIQILFGIAISAVKTIRNNGIKFGLSTIGTFLLLLGLTVLGSSLLGTDISKVQPYLKYPIYIGLAMILLFNSPGKNIILNILNGLWLLYQIITGYFGDILSYIRLFALCVSSAILGFVMNSIGSQMAGIPVVGPIIFILFMLFGHTLNIGLGGLSGFVHPLRLTFVEFYKNAAFAGPGQEYKPFGKKE
ncbi:MAG TPA: V-type ATPase 116kDa subunit family protein [Candidatus Cloacimonas sp.]|jgi:V/A-type H+-transporting ATPase subunit I|nr:V-type ATPase 116kDa subunit family protein [Candidatus Cloacimonadota bacterium]HOG27501.1 V-type ATPase 116kDa subunit family protein [Candidatus Cloacimonas sp.]MDD4676256.1 V-type ATPase 116kDa subunit family protein [Candidatus Cloacimonadota bacterium]HPH71524.1 V-type ATPase 116kDa subunit family protein [Candidatus Cloacimonas sp.]HPZ02241.1 V-type ATPase 116kDa subunit family protein [Candidatus Cloacimonas sp.]